MPFPTWTSTEAGAPAARHWLARARLAGALCAAALVAACAGDGPTTALLPPNPDVPQVAPDNFPTLGTTTATATATGRPPPLNPQERAKLEQELEALAKKREQELEKAIESDG